MTALFVPMQLDGLYLNSNRTIAGAFADFTQLPWVGGTREAAWDTNASHPWITETVARDPLGGRSTELEAGIHLHWSLPDSLTRATHPVVDGKRDQSALEFPSVPNRWLIVRRCQGVTDKCWLMESDYLWPVDYPWGEISIADFIKSMEGKFPARSDAPLRDPIWTYLCRDDIGWLLPAEDGQRARIVGKDDRRSNSLGDHADRKADILRTLHEAGHASLKLQRKLTNYPVPNVDSDGFSPPGNPPYRFMGRTRLINGQKGETTKSRKTPDYLTDTERLTAVGYGEPTFAAFYPNCRSVFGFHDEIDGEARTYVYDVYGWYSQPKHDILNADHARKSKVEDEDTAAFLTRIEKGLNWTLDGPRPETPPDGTLFYGRIEGRHFIPPSKGRIDGKIAPAARPGAASISSDGGLMSAQTTHVTVANSGTEALSAYLADRMAWARHGAHDVDRAAEKAKIETYLEALHLTPDLEHRLLDVGAKTAELRHSAAFDVRPGGRIWSIVQARADQDRSGALPSREVILPADLAVDLSALNRLQNDYEQGQRNIEALRWQIYSDWYRYMRYAYPRDYELFDLAASRNGHDVDIAISYLRQGALQALRELIDAVGNLHRSTGLDGTVTLATSRGSAPDSLARRLQQAWSTVDTQISGHNAKAKAAPSAKEDAKPIIRTWALKDLPGPRFYAPADPVLLLANGPIAATDRHDADHRRHALGHLECQTAEVDLTALRSDDPGQVDSAAKALIAEAGPKLDALERDTPTRIGFRQSKRPAGHPFMLEWQVEIAPVRTSAFGSSTGRKFRPDFLYSNWLLTETDCAMDERPDLTVRTRNASVLRGRGFFSSHAQELTRTRLETYIQRRLDTFFEATKTPQDRRTITYLDDHYVEVRRWFIDKGIQRTAAADGRELLRLQKAADASCVHGISPKGSLAKAILLAINGVPAREMREKLLLDPALVRRLLLHRAGPQFLASTIFDEGENRRVLMDKVLTALAVKADARKAISDNWQDFLGLLIQAVQPDDFLNSARQSGLPASTRLPTGPDAFETFVSVLEADETAQAILAQYEVMARAEALNPFTSLTQLAGLAAMNTNGPETGAAVFARILRFAQFNGYFKQTTQDAILVEERPSVIGLPTGGPIEAAVVSYVNAHLAQDDDTLVSKVGLPHNIVTELKLAGNVQSLLHLKTMRTVTYGALSKLVAFVDHDPQRLMVPADAGKAPVVSEDTEGSTGATMGASFAIPEAGGHAWVDPILTALEAWHILRSGFSGVTQSLSGFHDALLMKRKQWQLDVDDPLGFTPYRAFSQKTVKPVVGLALSNPLTDVDFYPIRSGDMGIMDLRLVDTFGQIHDIDTTDVVASTDLQSTRQLQVALPPRINQPARLNFRWLDAEEGRIEWNPHPATSPICGWVVPNVLEARVMIHAGDGAPLGSVDQTGRWRAPPAGSGGVQGPGDIRNPALRRLVLWLCREARRRDDAQPFVAGFVELCQTALHNIDPENFDHSGAKSLIMGRPMALVRAAVSFECEGPLAVKQSIETFGRELQGLERSTDGFESVRFPVRIGEHDQLNDGVVSFWPEDGDAYQITHYSIASAAEMRRAGIEEGLVKHMVGGLGGVAFASAAEFEQKLSALNLPLSDDDANIVRDLSARRDCFAPQNVSAASGDVQVPHAHKQGLNLWLPLAGADHPANVSVLMDPRGALHASSGVLPTKQLTIPPSDYMAAMTSIGISLLAAPLLSPQGQIEVLLPKEPGKSWVWVSKSDTGWTRVAAQPEITLSTFERAFPPEQAARIWGQLHLANWLKMVDDTPPRARVLPTPASAKTTDPNTLRNGRQASDLGDFAPHAEAILRVIEHGAQAIRRPRTEAHFAPQQINEGWLVLTPNDATASDERLDPEVPSEPQQQ